jgi:putative acetyltransferase
MLALYRRFGFAQCPPFGDYVVDPFSIYMARDI